MSYPMSPRQQDAHRRATSRGVQRFVRSQPLCPGCRKVRLMPGHITDPAADAALTAHYQRHPDCRCKDRIHWPRRIKVRDRLCAACLRTADAEGRAPVPSWVRCAR